MSLTKLTLLVGALLVLPLTGVQAQDDDALLSYRQKLMKSVGANKGAIDDIAKNELPFRDNIAAHARTLQEASTLIASAFKKEITEGRTDSQPAIWQEWDKYIAAADKMGEASAAVVAAVESGDDADLMAAMKDLGGSCGGCHKPYRKPKGERFER